jgi:predicted esterase
MEAPELHSVEDTLRFGSRLGRAEGACILIHGRGSSPRDIGGLGEIMARRDWAFLAPAARGGTWYPQRFLAPIAENEPWLSSAIGVIDALVSEARDSGLEDDRIALAGFSQGACLALEYAARHPARYRFVAGLSGALVGPLGIPRAPADLRGTPVLLGCAEMDPHIPLEHVEESARILAGMGAQVAKQIYPGGLHSLYPQEVEWLRKASG